MTSGKGLIGPSEVATAQETLIWDLRLKNPDWTQAQIGEVAGVSQQFVSRILARTRERVIQNLEAEVENEMIFQLNFYRKLLKEAYQAWQESRGYTVVTTTKKRQSDEGDDLTTSEVMTREENRPGDPRLLDQLCKIMSDVRSLLNMEKRTIELEVRWVSEIKHLLVTNQITQDDLFKELGDTGLARRIIDATSTDGIGD